MNSEESAMPAQIAKFSILPLDQRNPLVAEPYPPQRYLTTVPLQSILVRASDAERNAGRGLFATMVKNIRTTARAVRKHQPGHHLKFDNALIGPVLVPILTLTDCHPCGPGGLVPRFARI